MLPTKERRLVVISGIPGSGKTTIARRLAEILNTPVVEMDRYYLPPASPGAGVDFSDPANIDVPAVCAAIDRHLADGVNTVVLEGIFALAIGEIRDRALHTVWVEVPLDIGLARKLLRKLEEDADIRPSLLGYLKRGRAGYLGHVLPASKSADLHLDGTEPVEALIGSLIEQLAR